MNSTSPEDKQTMLVASLLGMALCTAFEAYGTITAMPVAAEELGHVDWYAWAFTAFLIAQVAAIVMSGRIVDRSGPVIPLIIGSAVFIAGLLMAGFALSMHVLLTARFVQGLGAGTTNVAFMVVVAQGFGKARRATVMSMLSFCWMLPSFVGPVVAAWLTETFSWHWVFLVLLPVLLIMKAVGWRPLMTLRARWTPNESSDPVPVWAAVVAAGGLAAVQYAAQRLGAAAVIAVMGLVALWVSVPRLMPPGFLRVSRGLGSVMWTRGLGAGAFFGAETFIPLLLRSQYDFSLSQAGMFLAVGAVSWAAGSSVQASARLRIRRDVIITSGVASLTGGLLINCVAVWGNLPWPLVAIGYAMGGLGMGLSVSSTSLANMQLSEPQQIGRNTSSLQVSEGLGNSLVTGLVGAVFAVLHGVAVTTVTFGAIQLLALLAAGAAVAASLRIGAVRNESSGVG